MKCAETILNDNNVLLLSPTGSGKKTFLLPILEMLQPEVLSVQCLILVPSEN
jgi:superfamily II DNA/RNA helicase